MGKKNPLKDIKIRFLVALVVTVIVYFLLQNRTWTIIAGIVAFGWAFINKLKKFIK